MSLSNLFELDENDPIVLEIDKTINMALDGLGYIEPVRLGDSLILRLFQNTTVTTEYRQVVYRTIKKRCPNGKLVLAGNKKRLR